MSMADHTQAINTKLLITLEKPYNQLTHVKETRGNPLSATGAKGELCGGVSKKALEALY